MTIVTEGPFSSSYKLISTIHEPCGYYDGQGHDGKYIVYVKGAPDQMLPLCSKQAKAGNTYTGEPIRRNYWTKQISILSLHGLRVPAVTHAVIPKSELTPRDQLDPELVKKK
jgi:magnesium-transporting ATPase (P-type)